MSIYQSTPALHGGKHEKRSSELTTGGGCQCVIMLNPAAVCVHKELQSMGGKMGYCDYLPFRELLFPSLISLKEINIPFPQRTSLQSCITSIWSKHHVVLSIKIFCLNRACTNKKRLEYHYTVNAICK